MAQFSWEERYRHSRYAGNADDGSKEKYVWTASNSRVFLSSRPEGCEVISYTSGRRYSILEAIVKTKTKIYCTEFFGLEPYYGCINSGAHIGIFEESQTFRCNAYA